MLKNKLSISTHQTASSFVYSDTLETTGTISSPKLDGDFILERPDLIYKTDILKQVIKNALLTRENRKLHLEIEHFPGFYPYHANCKQVSEPEFSEERKGGQIASISKTKLIEKVTNDFQQNSSYYSVLLYTYEWYLDEKELFTVLLRQFKKPLPIGMSAVEKNVFLASIISKTQMKILAFLKDWFKEYKNKFHDDSTLEEMFLELLFLMLTHPHTGEWIRQPISQLVFDLGGLESEKSQAGSRLVMKFTALPEVFIPFSIFVGYTHLLAKQLCIVDLENLKEVRPSEFKNRAWSKNDKHILAPNLTYIAEMSTRLSRFTSYMILMNKQRMLRALMYQYLIDLCDQLVSLKNYNSAFAVYLGLASPAIQRHKETFEPHLTKMHKDAFQTLEELFSSSNNMATLRKKQEELEAPAMPFLGIHLGDIFFAEELSDYVDKEKTMLNFNKFRVISTKINRLLSYTEPYGFHRVNNIITFIKGIPFISEEQIYTLSDYVWKNL